MNPLESFFFSPYGKAFVVMDEYRFLPLTYDMKQIVMGSSMANDNFFFYLPVGRRSAKRTEQEKN